MEIKGRGPVQDPRWNNITSHFEECGVVHILKSVDWLVDSLALLATRSLILGRKSTGTIIVLINLMIFSSWHVYGSQCDEFSIYRNQHIWEKCLLLTLNQVKRRRNSRILSKTYIRRFAER